MKNYQLKPGVYVARDDSVMLYHKPREYYGVKCIYLSPESTFSIANYIIKKNGERKYDHQGYGKWFVKNDSLYFDLSDSYKGDDGMWVIVNGTYSVYLPLDTMLIRNDTIINKDITFFRVEYSDDSIPTTINNISNVLFLRDHNFFIRNFNDLIEDLGNK